jgi:hypothetical protein
MVFLNCVSIREEALRCDRDEPLTMRETGFYSDVTQLIHSALANESELIP